MKNSTMRKKLAISFAVIDAILCLIMIGGCVIMHKLGDRLDDKTEANFYTIFCIVMFVVMALVMTTVTMSVLKTIRISTAKIAKAAEEISEGNLDVDLEKTVNDEFGRILDDCKKIVESMKGYSEIIEAVADGDLTYKVSVKSEKDTMGSSLYKLVNGTNGALSNISESAFQVMTSSSEVASASEALAQGSTEQASAIEEITVSINDISEKTKTNASSASEAAVLMNEAILDVNKGNQRMQDMVGAMNDINVSSESISKIIKVIDDIAFQTNILALNAAVEAARAGDAGMGFAVVAEEVRSLAAKSATAAAETAEMIEDSIKKVHAGTAIADETAKALETISEIVSKSEGIVKAIAESSNYQATAIDQIDQAISQVSQVVQSNSSTSEQCAAASIELSAQAKHMQELVGVYNLGNSNMKQKTRNSKKKTNYSNDRNEAIISLKDGFGKY